MPEEIIYASGAIPVCLADGGDSSVVEASLSVMPHRFCPFVRAQIGGIMLKSNPYFELIDLLIAPILCQHLKKLAEIIEHRRDVDMVKIGIPHSYESEAALEYCAYQLEKLKNRLQAHTGNDVTNEKIVNAIELYNSMRDILREISFIRTKASSTISSLDFIKLNHATFYADPVFMVEVLQDILKEIKEQQVPEEPDKGKKPRLLLVGPNLVYGDYKVLDLVEAAGGRIVIEEISEGIRNYWKNISSEEDPIDCLAKGYLRDRVPCAFMVHSGKQTWFCI